MTEFNEQLIRKTVLSFQRQFENENGINQEVFSEPLISSCCGTDQKPHYDFHTHFCGNCSGHCTYVTQDEFARAKL